MFEGGQKDELQIPQTDEPDFYKYNEYICTKHEGEYFGEISLITNLKRTTTAKTVDFSTIAYMKRENFEEIWNEFP